MTDFPMFLKSCEITVFLCSTKMAKPYDPLIRNTREIATMHGENMSHIQGVKNNVHNVSRMIEEVKTNTFLFEKTLAYAPFCR